MTQRPADRLIFVPALTSPGGGDVTAQTGAVLARLEHRLGAAGSDLAHAATVHVYLRRGEDFAAMNAVYAKSWSAEPPSRTTVVADLPHPDALVAMSAVAVARGGSRRAVNPAGWARSPLPYSYAVRAGDVLLLSGLVARDSATNRPVEGSAGAQLDLIMSNAREILGAAGLSLDHVVSARVYLADAASFTEMNDGWRRHFSGAKPARATVIAGLMQPAYRIEVTLVAHAGEPRHLPADPPNANLSAAVSAGSMVFVSGMLAAGARGAAAQTRETLDKARAVLARAGVSPADVVETTVWVPDLAHLAAVDQAYGEMFAGEAPSRVTVGAGLVAKDALVEIAMTAIRPSTAPGAP